MENSEKYNEIIFKIDEIISKKEHIIISIDGRCGAGKTTLAEKIGKKYKGEIISMDDFFLPFEKRTEKRLQEPGGNIDYERFLEEVVKPLQAGKNIVYGKFSCKTGKIETTKSLKPKRVIVVEGSYSNHEYFGYIYDIKIFLTVDSAVQIKRIVLRNGLENAENFKNRWIPMEEKYFTSQGIIAKSDIIMDTTQL